jgi:hypothetical protein
MIGILSLGLVAGGCSSSPSTGGTGTGGKGGGSAGSGGSSGQGGSTGDAAATLGCPASDPPPSATIADFMGADGGLGLEIMGGISTFGGMVAPTYTTTGGTLNIMENATPGTAAAYPGLVIYFNGNTAGTDCIDAHSYMGVKFDIKGTLMNCTMQYSNNDAAHGDSTQTGNTKASGPAGSYPPQIGVTPTAANQTLMIPFTGSNAPTGGSPMSAVDPTKITGIQWQFTVPAAGGDAGSAACMANLTIDNIAFY